MRKALPFLVAIGVLAISAAAAMSIVSTVRQTTAPVTGFTSDVGTQIAQVLHPTPTIRPDPVTIVREVRSLARLETIQYSVEKVITAETGQGPFGFLFGDRLLLVAHGYVIAGVDLGQLSGEDAWYDDLGVLNLRLPPAEVFVATLDNETSYVFDRDTGLLAPRNISLEAEARRAAEAEISRAALEDGIVEQAQFNAESFLSGFLRSLGLREVVISFDEAEPTPGASATP
jgi:hypothetical protein